MQREFWKLGKWHFKSGNTLLRLTLPEVRRLIRIKHTYVMMRRTMSSLLFPDSMFVQSIVALTRSISPQPIIFSFAKLNVTVYSSYLNDNKAGWIFRFYALVTNIKLKFLMCNNTQ